MNEEFILDSPKNVKTIAKVFRGWLGGDCISVNQYLDGEKNLIPVLSIYNFDDEPMKTLYHLTPNTSGNYEVIKADKIKLSNYPNGKLEEEVRQSIISDLNKVK